VALTMRSRRPLTAPMEFLVGTASLAPLGGWGDERSPGDDDLVQIMLVAGACSRRYLQLWSGAA
jgi:hypothetical protein